MLADVGEEVNCWEGGEGRAAMRVIQELKGRLWGKSCGVCLRCRVRCGGVGDFVFAG